MKKIVFCFFLFILGSCSKDKDDPTPIPDIPLVDLYSGCRVSSIQTDVLDNTFYDLETKNFAYDQDGFLTATKADYSKNGVPFPVIVEYQYSYIAGKLQSIATPDKIEKEVYEYTNGFLTKIKLESTNNINYNNYIITIKNDDQGQPQELTDNRGFKSTVSRDKDGNIIEVKKVDNTGKELYRLELSRYDGMKSTFALFKGIYFDNSLDISEYLEKPLFNANAGGNPRSEKIYRNQNLEADLDLAYQYSSEGYPISVTITDKLIGNKSQIRINLKGCK